MGYLSSDTHVRVDLFKPSGKWYEDFSLDMTGFYAGTLIHAAVREAFNKQYPSRLHEGWRLVCLEPYHEHSHPVMIKGE